MKQLFLSRIKLWGKYLLKWGVQHHFKVKAVLDWESRQKEGRGEVR